MLRTRTHERSKNRLWYKSASYLLNNVAPALIHDYAKNRYYNTTDGVISFPVTTTRTTNATMFDSSGNLVWAPANMIAQSSTTGAVLGVIGSGLTFLVGGILVVLGTWVDLGALLIAITVILAALIFHQYWKETDANTKMQETMAFNKDLALGGAALILFALVAGGLVTDFGPSVGTLALFG